MQAADSRVGHVGRRAQLLTADGVAFPLALVLALAAARVLIIHNDLGWHLRSGELILATRSVPLTDSWPTRWTASAPTSIAACA